MHLSLALKLVLGTDWRTKLDKAFNANARREIAVLLEIQMDLYQL